MILARWAVLQYQLDSLGLRERISVAVLILTVFFFAWYGLLYGSQEKMSADLKLKTDQTKSLLGIFLTESNRITKASKAAHMTSAVSKYKKIKQQIADVDMKMLKHKQKVISERQVSQVIYAVLNDIQGVSLKSFVSENEAEPDLKTSIKDKGMKPLDKLGLITKGYQLTLTGRYFAIEHYLGRLEKLAWQFYWDTFEYKVTRYPMAETTIKFHTLSTDDE